MRDSKKHRGTNLEELVDIHGCDGWVTDTVKSVWCTDVLSVKPKTAISTQSSKNRQRQDT
jgi:hypothetical protein